MALLVITIVMLVATSLTSDALVTFRRVENQIYNQQAYVLLRAAEGAARSILRDDASNGAAIDHFSEGWLNIETPPQEIGPASYSGVLCDLQGRFNINGILAAGSAGNYTNSQQQFMRLLLALPLEPSLDPSEVSIALKSAATF
ncbi:type II secretion system protein GspK [bacterium]|nr:type II secretion system protein GspK [bacterium]